MNISCPNCGTDLELPDDVENGQHLECPDCSCRFFMWNGECRILSLIAVPAAVPPSSRPIGRPVDVKIPNYMIGSVLSTAFCCLLGGIFSIVHSSRVSQMIAKGDLQGARTESKAAAHWIVFNVIWGVLSVILWCGKILAENAARGI